MKKDRKNTLEYFKYKTVGILTQVVHLEISECTYIHIIHEASTGLELGKLGTGTGHEFLFI